MPGFVHLRFTCKAKFSGQGRAVAEPGSSDQAGPKLFTMNDHYYWLLECPCGVTLRADTEDAIVELSFDHLRETHPDLADIYEREHILFMAQQFAAHVRAACGMSVPRLGAPDQGDAGFGVIRIRTLANKVIGVADLARHSFHSFSLQERTNSDQSHSHWPEGSHA